MLPKLLLSLFAAGAALCVAPGVGARKMTKQHLHAKQVEAAKRWQVGGNSAKRASGGSVKNITFSNPKASRELLLFDRDSARVWCIDRVL